MTLAIDIETSGVKVLTENRPQVAMMPMIFGFMVSQAIHVAAKLGIADLLKDEPKGYAELACATATHAPSLYRVLRALASAGVFAETEPGVFGLTPLGETLRSDVPGSMRAMSVFMGEQCNWQAWGDILHSVKTGESAFEHVFGMGFFQHLERHPEAARVFSEAMTSNSEPFDAAVTAGYDFSGISRIIDLGGGHGSLISSILKAYPNMKGILFDAPHVSEGARSRLKAEGVSERCEVIAGDFLESIPGGADAYMMKHIIHDWDDANAVAILKNCRRAMPEGAGKLLLIEEVLPCDNTPALAKLIDLEMLLMPGGRERTEAEYRTLFEAAGFRLTSVTPTQSPLSVIEGVPV
jgi:O-methyltransferase domain/Dimerisation domain